MLTLGVETIIVLLLITGVVCAFAGYTFAQARQRHAGGGKSAEELKTELAEYKENVSEHFQTTATLLHEMTEQYRSVYEHMAAGAQALCDSERGTSQLDRLAAGLLPVTVVDGPGNGRADDNLQKRVIHDRAVPGTDASAQGTRNPATVQARSEHAGERGPVNEAVDERDRPDAAIQRSPETPQVHAEPPVDKMGSAANSALNPGATAARNSADKPENLA